MSELANSVVTKGCAPDTQDCESTAFVWRSPQALFEDNRLVRICAPMVRYSKYELLVLLRNEFYYHIIPKYFYCKHPIKKLKPKILP